MLRTLRFVFFTVVLLFVQQFAFAAVEPYQNFLKGRIKVGDSLLVKDEKFKNPSFNWADITNISVKNTVSLQLLSEQAIAQSFSCKLTFRVEYFSSPAQVEPTKIDSASLSINYDKTAGAAYKGKDIFSFENGYYVKVYVTGISSPQYGSQLPEVIQLTSHIDIDRKYVFKPFLFIGLNGETTLGTQSGLRRLTAGTRINNNRQLALSWGSVLGAEEYDIEWVAVDAESEWGAMAQSMAPPNTISSTNYSSAQIAPMFRNNATRITTYNKQQDTISLVYNADYIVVRIRQVSYTPDGLRNEGEWFYTKENNTEYAAWPLDWHEPNLNWQYSAAFAEEGKKKEVISYFDGSLRGRQTVTLNSSDNVAVVQENVYDQFGRASASILPAPVRESNGSSFLHYFPAFNVDEAGHPYSLNNLNLSGCEIQPAKLGTGSGASNYYSGEFLGTTLGGERDFNKYIPDAEKYPLSVTQYTADNTGRIKLQGGVGPMFQPGPEGGRRTTRYYYGKPQQEELDILFGNDVGYAEHYLKNMVVDPNGQISISYLNAGGKTVATALAGRTPDNVDGLASKPAEKEVRSNILKPEQFQFNASTLSLSATTTYMASVTGDAKFKFDLEKLIHTYPEGPFHPCSSCYYELTVSIVDDCKNKIPFSLPGDTLRIGTSDVVCDYISNLPDSISTIFPNIGEYYITFNFALSKKVIDKFTDNFINKGQEALVLKKRADFVIKYLEENQFSNCFTDCSTARAKLGTEQAFTAMFKDKLMKLGEENPDNYNAVIHTTFTKISDSITVLVGKCAQLSSPCEVYRKAMLLDVSPGGQYAMLDAQGNMTEPLTNVLLINFHNTVFIPTDSESTAYKENLVTKEDGSTTSPYDANFSHADLVKYWKPEWAEVFLTFHPEKCKLDFCNQQVASKMWDQKIEAIEEASTAGYNTDNTANWLLSLDPFFNGAGSVYAPQMLIDLQQYSNKVLNLTSISTKSLSKVVDFLIYCAPEGSTTNGAGTPTNNWDYCSPVYACRVFDREWALYRTKYLELKNKYYNQLRDATTCQDSKCVIGAPFSTNQGAPSTGNTCTSRLMSTESFLVSTNTYRTKDILNNIQTTYYYVAGNISSPPNAAGYCSQNTVSMTFKPCIDVILGSSTTRYNGVWEIICKEPIPVGCGLTYEIYADELNGPNKFYRTYYPERYYFTVIEGYDQNNEPPAYCPPNGDSLPTYFYPCLNVYVNGSAYSYTNVWLSTCITNLNPGGGGGGGGGNPCDVPVSSMMRAVADNVNTNLVQPCEETIQLQASRTVNQEVVADYQSHVIYSVSTVAEAQAKSGVEAKKSAFRKRFGNYTFKPYFALKIRAGEYKIFRNVYVANYIPDTSSVISHRRKIERFLKERKASKTMALARSASTDGQEVQNIQESQSFGITSGNHIIYTEQYSNPPVYMCRNEYYYNEERQLIFTLVNSNNQPVIATSNITIKLQFYHIYGSFPQPPQYWFSYVTIVAGQSSNSLIYQTRAYTDNGSACVADDNYFDGIVEITGLDDAASCPPIYATKKSSFDPVVTQASTNPYQYESDQQAALSSQVATASNYLADVWIERLKKGLDARSIAESDRNTLRANLIALSSKAADVNHPFGASTLADGQPSLIINGNQARSFGDVIRFTLNIGAFDDLLNPWLIDSPYPYEPLQQATEQFISSTTDLLCNKLASLRTSTDNAVFYQNLKDQYGTVMNLSLPEFLILVEGCENCKHLLKKDIKLPVFLQEGTKGCITKGEFDAAMTEMRAAFYNTINTSWSNYQTIVTNYINQKFGFTLSYDDYNAFEGRSGLLCNETGYGTIADDPYACAKSLIELSYGMGNREYEVYIAEERQKFADSYISTCAAAKANVTLTAKEQTYHYTLYYYDLAGNLIRTVPPEGVTLLQPNDMELVKRNRAFKTSDCSGEPERPITTEASALSNLSSILQNTGNNAIEMWLYAALDGSRQFIGTTPDMKYMLQACVNGNLVNVDIFTLNQTAADNVSITLSNHVTADVSDIFPLAPWTHLVVQGANLAQGALQIYVNGKGYAPVAGAPTAGCGWAITSNPIAMPHNFANIKYLRTYHDRLMSAGEIAANAASGCFAAIDENAIARFRFNQPAPGGPTTLADNSTQETQYNGIYPGHVLKTSYVYNATNQVLQQETPDGGASNFWYDYLSRLVFSQNAKQAATSDYSFTNYDALGRIFEVGQKNLTGDKKPTTPYLEDSRYREILNNNTGADSQITQTFYDDKAPGSAGVNITLEQDNLRKRVSASIYRDNRSTAAINASYYSYDVGGNVKRLYQQINGLGIKTLDYEYDLISGKVNLLAYQHSRTATPEKDQFYYKYDYDSENRLIAAWTSTRANMTSYGFGSELDNDYKRLDASYQYYLHGPLARMELGRATAKVQGVDYAYTLQGWLKGVNGATLNDASKDIGADGTAIAKDALAYSLGYYNGDYKAISTAAGAFEQGYQGNNNDAAGKPLFNGNISNSTYAIAGINGGATVGYSYGYDQLNRIKTFRHHEAIGGTWNSGSAGNKYKEDFTYDGNGNILALQRSNQGGITMDAFDYKYERDTKTGRLTTNRLRQVADAVGGSAGDFDLAAGQIAENYRYDQIGNMIGDNQSGVNNIDWSVYGKIRSIDKGGNNIAYTYDPSGNRVSKTTSTLNTYYVRDAQGNNLAVYDNEGGTINWQEQTLYGSSRLGMWRPSINLAVADGTSQWGTYGKKFFELSNHLGNVLSVINDNRDFNGNEFLPVAVSGNDYYAFGGQMPGRAFNSSNYRYGFNGKENDNEVKGTGNQQDYGMRIYDPRIGKFLSVDPITKQYPELTPYQFASNTPIAAIDRDGLESAVMIVPRGVSNYDHMQVIQGMNKTYKNFFTGVFTASDVNDATVITTWMTRGNNAINFDGSPATSWDKGLAAAGAVIPFVSGSLLKQSAKWGAKSAEWLYHASKGTKVADAILDNSALRKALGAAIKAGEEAHHIIPVQLLKEEKVVQDAVNAGFEFNTAVNGIALKKYTKAGEAVVDGGVHANHPNYTKQIRKALNDFSKANKNYTPAQAKEFLNDLVGELKSIIKKESIDGGKKINDIKIK
ncbi:AHH domain-containing protein [Pedobacter sp. ISL-68]|uniref:RHS repeat-associated core domain-containing protein n=1 Tax=unclassified Pedobacter TaxID=2628915 RepID=UPI001BECE332|nr:MULTISPECIES: RHS repeat-associated core domain-containing protein [unclassified Pedobacter]MBT2563802.1 AHH domain-containing protein [Pedobacter sp. ISL-64]MBT2592792.1 AHH domain-containing protein [Pedobacter sp. ISL-68]